MNIFCIDCPYAGELAALGHKIMAPVFQPGVIYLPGILQMHDFKPDLLIQHERLSPRVIAGGLEKMPCPTVFVSVDSHLNMFWHKYYARLFDLVLTPHLSIFNRLPEEERPPQVRRFGPGGYRQSFTNFADRRHDLSFVGLLTEHRPARTAMVRLLAEKFGLYRPEKPLPHDRMLGLFMDTRMVPNESIAREVNFRLFEAASCGSLVFCQTVGEDQNAHFEPGLEFETYEHSLELVDKIRFYRKHLPAAEKVGRAAWERVRAEHLPEHRAAQLAGLGQTVRRRAEAPVAAAFFWLTLAQMARNGMSGLPVEWFLTNPPEEDREGLVAAMKLRLLWEGSWRGNPLYSQENTRRYRDEAVETILGLLASGRYADSLECNLAGAMIALALGRPGWAGAFWRRQIRSLKELGDGRALIGRSKSSAPFEDYLAWAGLLSSLERYAQVGFNFRPQLGCVPGSAFECLVMAQAEAGPEQDAWLPEMHRICLRVPGFGYWDMGLLAEISLKDPENWRRQLEYGMSSLENYRLEAGLFELSEARIKAGDIGELEYFNTALEGLPSSGYILSALLKG